MRLKTLGIALLIFLLFTSPVRAASATVNDISEQLICQCGCTMIVSNCQCATREAMVALIEQKLAQGQSEEEIILYFVAQYGEEVLASPPKRGFNLVAWVLPFAVILGGGGVIYFAIKAWVKQGSDHQTDAETEAEEGDEEYQSQLKRELAEFTERGFR